MVGFADSIAAVKASIAAHDLDLDIEANRASLEAADHERVLRHHDRILREHEEQMDEHRRAVREHRHRRERSPPGLRFRFKDGKEGGRGRKRRRGSRGREAGEGGRRKSRRTDGRGRSEDADADADAELDGYTAHPLPRPRREAPFLDPTVSASASASPPPLEAEGRAGGVAEEEVPKNDNDAFRASLFDAIADDEGAAYWEGVYSQPIHIYARPVVQTEDGGVEEMDDEQYVEYVKRKMWERKNPHLVAERRDRERRERERGGEEEEAKRERRRRARRRAEREAWGQSDEDDWRRGDRGEGDKGFMADVDEALRRGEKRKEAKRWQAAWTAYQAKWEHLKTRTAHGQLAGTDLANAIPWPTMSGNLKDADKAQVEDFYLNAPLREEEGETRLGLLKTERVKWHPDKIQHRFGGENVDEDMLRKVTGVFQTLDDMVARERKRSGND
ncbi:hypothetical protein M8818_005430 [Zalaria obscura]|uniref:Uncharacterized protein n=1 Tax=Zalaria obscura TaxID=2024903 RepID=A0ACC3S9T1_9PEZI